MTCDLSPIADAAVVLGIFALIAFAARILTKDT